MAKAPRNAVPKYLHTGLRQAASYQMGYDGLSKPAGLSTMLNWRVFFYL